jgi:hypothetical protein
LSPSSSLFIDERYDAARGSLLQQIPLSFEPMWLYLDLVVRV